MDFLTQSMDYIITFVNLAILTIFKEGYCHC